MNWPRIDEWARLMPLPSGYGFGRLDRAHVPSVIAALKSWHPDISVGMTSCYLREEFYRDRVCLDGETGKDVWVVRILFEDELIGVLAIEREVDSLAIYGRLIALSPAHRGERLSVHVMVGSENIGRAMGAAFLYALATLKHPFAQRALERGGYRLLAFFPGYDREEVSPGVVKRVYLAVYAKLLVSEDDVHWPDPKNMTTKTRALYELLFSDRPATAA